MARSDSGSTPLDRLQAHFEDVDMTCPGCGYADEDGVWEAETDGGQIRYRHLCPSCGEIKTRTITIEE